MQTSTTVTITVDGKTVECRPGELLIAAAERGGIFIPRFCWHPRMDPVGACRMCLVNIEGSPPIPGTDKLRPQTACTTPVREGMVVSTQFSDEEINRAQKGMLEFLLINHPLDCPICDRGGECPLQDQTLDYGPSESRFVEPKRRFVKPVEISPLVKLDRERCILCYRCTRFCEEISGDTMIATMQRGPHAYIYTFEEEIFDSYFSGNTVQICPVGALTSSTYRFAARPWDLQLQPTTCNLCASGCAITADVRVSDGKLVRVSGRVNEDVNEEWLCDKGRYAHAYVSSPQRLVQPLIRKGSELAAVTWDEAFRVLGEHVAKAAESGRSGVIVGGSLADEDAYVAQKFARLALKTNSVDHRLEGGMEADALLPPQLTYADLLAADLVVVVGADLREELPLVFLRLRVAASKGRLKIALVHPRRASLADFAVSHLAPLPQAEHAVGAAVAAALGAAAAAGVEATAAAAGLAPADVRAFADALHDAGNAVILLGPAACRPDAIRAWSAVASACGAKLGWAPRRAGEYGALAAGAHPDLLPGYRRLADQSARSAVEEAWGSSIPQTAGRDVAGMLSAGRAGELDLLWVVGADLLSDVPDVPLVADGMTGAAAVIVQDVQQTPMLRFADVVLPAAAFVERSGTLTNWEGRRQPLNQAVDPPGAARADYAILAEAARRAGAAIGCRTFDATRLELDGLLGAAPGPSVAGSLTVRTPDVQSAYPLRLLSYRLLYDMGSRVHHVDAIRRMTAPATAEIHPDDARAAGVADGAGVRVSSVYGTIGAWARVSDAVRPGVVFVPYAQPGDTAQGLMAWGDTSPGVRVEPA